MKKIDGVVKYFESRGDNFAFCISPGLLEFKLKKECFLSLPGDNQFAADHLIGRKAIIWCDENSNIYEIEIEEININFKLLQPWIVYWTAFKSRTGKYLVPMELNWRNRLMKQTKDKLIDFYLQNAYICRIEYDELFLHENPDLETEMFLWAKDCGGEAAKMILSDLVELAPSLFSSLAYQIKITSKSEISESARNNRCSFEEGSRVPDLYNTLNYETPFFFQICYHFKSRGSSSEEPRFLT